MFQVWLCMLLIDSGAGGKSVSEDIRKLEHGQHIVTGTPGRVHDMIQRKTFRMYLCTSIAVFLPFLTCATLSFCFFPMKLQTGTSDVKLLILDEADEMLGMGFKDQIFDIYRYMPSDVQGESSVRVCANSLFRLRRACACAAQYFVITLVMQWWL